jgi:ubiquinone/menaquinone biosynthesis C-methylase UbiE
MSTLLSRQASAPRGLFGRLIGRIWVAETRAVNDTAHELLAPQPEEHIAEIGFGPGRGIQQLARQAARVSGIEVSDTMISVARRRNADAVRNGRVRLLRGDGTTLPLDSDSVDGVVAVHTLYFWPEPDTTFADIARVLRPGGRLVLAFRDGAHPAPSRFDLSIYRLHPAAEVVAMLERAGFTDIEVHAPADQPHHIVWIRARVSV